MTPGPPPKSTEQKRLLGNPGKRALPAPPVRLAASSSPPPPPPTLLDRGAGRQAWDRLWLAASGWLSPSVDYAIMTRLCESYDLRGALLEAIGQEGYTVPGSQGQPRPHPLLDHLRTLEDQLLKLEACCGFTPSDRMRLGLAEVKARNKLEELLQRQRGRRDLEDGTPSPPPRSPKITRPDRDAT